MTFALTVSHHI